MTPLSMYTGAKTVVRTVYGNCNSSDVEVGMHHSSALSPLPFVIVMEALSREFEVASLLTAKKLVDSFVLLNMLYSEIFLKFNPYLTIQILKFCSVNYYFSEMWHYNFAFLSKLLYEAITASFYILVFLSTKFLENCLSIVKIFLQA